MLYKFGEQLIDINVEKTRKFYKTAKTITQGCNCDGCCNYEEATAYFPNEVKTFFENIGVDLKKAAEIIAWVSENDKKDVYYGGFYHVCGRIISEDNLWKSELVDTDTTVCHLDEDEMFMITENYRIGFCNGSSLLEEGFPLPAIQIEILFTCPWVISKENRY